MKNLEEMIFESVKSITKVKPLGKRTAEYFTKYWVREIEASGIKGEEPLETHIKQCTESIINSVFPVMPWNPQAPHSEETSQTFTTSEEIFLDVSKTIIHLSLTK